MNSVEFGESGSNNIFPIGNPKLLFVIDKNMNLGEYNDLDCGFLPLSIKGLSTRIYCI